MSGNMEVKIASGDELDIREFSVHQSMSQLFTVTITALCKNADVDFEAVVGQEASFALHGTGTSEGKPKTWQGVCSEMHQVGVEEDGTSTYHLTLVPKLWLASQRTNHRMFQVLSELDIVEKLLKEWGITYEKRIKGQYKTRKYKVQYGETDFDFMCRMLEDAGISFAFEDQDGKTVMIVTDSPQSNEARGSSIPFRAEPNPSIKEHVTAVRVSRVVKPGKLTVRDHDYRLPASYKLIASAEGEAEVEKNLETFEYSPGAFLFENDKGDATPFADDRGKHRTDEAEGNKLAQKRLHAARGDASQITFLTNVVDLAPGAVMSVLDHPARELGDGKKLLVVESRISGHRDEDINHYCELRSADKPYHPARVHQKPKVQGVESATVVGASGDEIHTDEFGRVRVHFHWDRESKMDDNSSCWIHVSQPWGGSGFGGSNLPRVGQEVIVDFLGGDPDRPVIVGRVYTNLQKTPYKLPQNKTQSGWKSNSTNNTGGFNEMMFEDKAGSELLRMRAEKDMTTRVNNNQQSSVGANRKDTIEGNDKESVLQNQSHNVDGNKSTSVGKDQIMSTLGNLLKMTGGDQVLSTIGQFASQALAHQITSDQGTTLTVGSSTIHISPSSIVIQSDKLLLNPGADVAAKAALGGSTSTG